MEAIKGIISQPGYAEGVIDMGRRRDAKVCTGENLLEQRGDGLEMLKHHASRIMKREDDNGLDHFLILLPPMLEM
jgi:hypothetical protein